MEKFKYYFSKMTRLFGKSKKRYEKLVDYIQENGLCSLEELEKSKLDLNAPDKRGYTPLMLYCEEGRTEEALFLMNQKGALINAHDKFGYTPLMKAVASENVDLVEALLALHADVKPRNVYGFTALSTAISHQNRDMVVLLLDNGANMREALDNSANLKETAAKIGVTMKNTGQVVLMFPDDSRLVASKKNCLSQKNEHTRE